MKKIFIIAFVLLVVTSCNKKQVGTETTVEQLKSKYGIDLIGMWEKQFGSVVARGGPKKPKADQVVVVWFNDLVLTQVSGDNFSSTLSENAQWFAYQVFQDITTVDGAYSLCNHYYATPDQSPANEPCTVTGTGFVRTFTSDFDYNIHISNVIQK